MWMLALALASAADLTQQLRLLDADGAPLNGPVDLRVDLVADETPGAPDTTCHVQSFGAVPVVDGFATVRLTNVSTACGQGAWWVAVSTGSPPAELGPRLPLSSVPHALSAGHVAGYVDLFVDEDFSDGPPCAVEGRLAWEGGSNTLVVCDGTQWLQVGGNTLGTEFDPALSCKTLHAARPELPSGVYWLDSDGVGTADPAYRAYCDMVTDDGGWTLVYKIADNSSLKTTGASGTDNLLVDDITLATSGKFADATIRELYTEQYRTEQYGTTPYRTWCTLDNENTYADGVNNSKRCATSYSAAASYGTVVSNAQWSYGLSDYTGGNGLIFQLNYGDSRLGCHTRSGASSNTDAGCTSTGGCHCRAWVR